MPVFLLIGIAMGSMSAMFPATRATDSVTKRLLRTRTHRSLLVLRCRFFTSRDGDTVSTMLYLKCEENKLS